MYPNDIYYYLSGILLILIVLKTILYIGSTSRHNFSSWFFFTPYAIYNSHNERSRKLKVLQNRLTLVIIVVAVADAITILMFH